MLNPEHVFEAGKVEALRDHIDGRVNVTHAEILSNIRRNIRRHLPQAQPCPVQPDVQVMLLCGGPSMKKLLPEIKKRRRAGWKIAAVNGAHDWCLDNGMEPSAQVMLDARKWNARFVQRPIEACQYLIASQVTPAVFDALEGFKVTIWHGVGAEEKPVLDRFYNKRYCPVTGGTTVGSRAINLLYMLGFRKIAVYGMDCCISKNGHHAYAQPENDQEICYELRVGRRRFWSHPWMTVQADEMLQMLPILPNDLDLVFAGDGVISYVIGYVAKHGRVPKMSIIEEARR